MEEYRCVKCGFRIKRLFVQYSPGNIRLMKCVFVDVFVANFLFLYIFLLAMRIFQNNMGGVSRFKEFCLAMIVSSYFKIVLIAMMVWEFPPSVVPVIDLFVLSSNIVALQVVCGLAMKRCIWTCFCAHALKLLAPRVPELCSLR